MNILHALDDYLVYLSYTKGLSNNTVIRAKMVNAMFCRNTGINQFENITQKVVEDFFQNGRVKLEWKPSTFDTYHKTIMYFFRYACKQGYLQENNAEGIERPKMHKSLPRSFHQDKAEAWLRYVKNYPYNWHQVFCSKRNHAIYATFLFTGLRRSELCRLEMEDLDLKNRELKVIEGKGKKDRVIPLCFAYINIMREWLEIRNKYRKKCPNVFTSCTRDRELSISSLIYIHGELRKHAPFYNTLHQWRHTFATLMIQGGVDLPSLKAMMGHSDISTTMKYVSVSTHHLQSQIIKHPLNYS
jgi:site-specific recombinase XerD